ncbi:MAG: gliding motility lipoprotein GldB [Flavobacteriaceae bacterium]|jgi:hypothetical protein
MIDYKIFNVILFIFLLNILGCFQEKQTHSIDIVRFEKEFYSSNEQTLPVLINKYPYLFPKEYHLSIWNQFLKDSVKLEIYKETLKVFQNFDSISNEIQLIFENSKVIFPKFKSPKVITLNSQSEYSNRIIYSDSLLFISLDSYLGENYYKSLPKYISQNMNKVFLINDLALKISENHVKKDLDRTLLSEMIYYGKILFINKLLLLKSEDYLLFHTSKDKIHWANNNENNIWAFFVENEYLFNTSDDLKLRFISIAPYSKFNLDIDKYSPGSIGKWLGYKIVNSYMINTNVSIDELIKMDNYKIFKKSNYKPKKL